MKRARAHLHVVGLQDHAALLGPEGLQARGSAPETSVRGFNDSVAWIASWGVYRVGGRAQPRSRLREIKEARRELQERGGRYWPAFGVALRASGFARARPTCGRAELPRVFIRFACRRRPGASRASAAPIAPSAQRNAGGMSSLLTIRSATTARAPRSPKSGCAAQSPSAKTNARRLLRKPARRRRDQRGHDLLSVALAQARSADLPSRSTRPYCSACSPTQNSPENKVFSGPFNFLPRLFFTRPMNIA